MAQDHQRGFAAPGGCIEHVAQLAAAYRHTTVLGRDGCGAWLRKIRRGGAQIVLGCVASTVRRGIRNDRTVKGTYAVWGADLLSREKGP
jgi:hypothetical protein